jgi:pimeloyl-ACP methyl ester carboxylesterase
VHGQVVGSGHFLQLEVPDQVNAMIRRFLTTYLPRASQSL